MKGLIDVSQLAGYIQIKDKFDKSWSTEMSEIFSKLICDSFKIAKISDKKDIWSEFVKLLGGKYAV